MIFYVTLKACFSPQLLTTCKSNTQYMYENNDHHVHVNLFDRNDPHRYWSSPRQWTFNTLKALKTLLYFKACMCSMLNYCKYSFIYTPVISSVMSHSIVSIFKICQSYV